MGNMFSGGKSNSFFKPMAEGSKKGGILTPIAVGAALLTTGLLPMPALALPWWFKACCGVGAGYWADKGIAYLRTYKIRKPAKNLMTEYPEFMGRLFKVKDYPSRFDLHFAVRSGLLPEKVEEIRQRLEIVYQLPVECVLNKKRLVAAVYKTKLPTDLNFPEDAIVEGFKGKCIWLVGKTVSGKWLMLDLVEGGKHLLLAGATNAGKSVGISSALYANILIHGDSIIRIFGDLKGGATGDKFKRHMRVCKNILELAPVLVELVKESQRRNALLPKYKVENWRDLPEEVRKENKYILLVIDEYFKISPDFEKTNKKLKDFKSEIHNMVMELAAQGRSAGIHVVVCTQRPEEKVLPLLFKANIEWRVCYPVENRHDSTQVLGHSGAERLKTPGRCIVRKGLEETVCQGPILKDAWDRLDALPAFVEVKEQQEDPEEDYLEEELIDDVE